jgi:predicted transcriptional regulator
MPLPYAGLMKKDTSVNVRLTSELRAELQSLADADDRKLSAYIERVLQAHVTAKKSASESEPAKKR